MKNVINEFRANKSARFVGFDYTNKQNEKSNYVVLCGVDYGNAVDKKIKALESLDANDLIDIAKLNPLFNVDIVATAASKLLEALIKNKNKETASNQSKGQNDSYATVGGRSGIRLHLETKKLYAYGFLIKRTVLKAGDPKKPVNSSALTLAKRAIEKHLGFPTFVNLEIEKEDTVIKLNKKEFQI